MAISGKLTEVFNSIHTFPGGTKMRARSMVVVLLVVCFGATEIRAQEKPPALERSELDKLIIKIVFDAASQGTEIYNKGNAEGCFRLYQGTLMAVQPLLKDYRQRLSISVKDKMERAKTMTTVDGA